MPVTVEEVHGYVAADVEETTREKGAEPQPDTEYAARLRYELCRMERRQARLRAN